MDDDKVLDDSLLASIQEEKTDTKPESDKPKPEETGEDHIADTDSDEDDEDTQDDHQEEEKPLSRSAKRVQNAVRLKAEAEAKRAAAEAETMQLRQQLEQTIAQQRQQEMQRIQAEEARILEDMSPEQQAVYKSQKQIDALRADLERVRFEGIDNADRQLFHAKAASDPIFKQYGEKVEAELQKMRSKGLNAPREELLAYMVGRDLLNKAQTKSAKGAPTGASERVDASAARNVSARGEATTAKSGRSLEDRLANVQL